MRKRKKMIAATMTAIMMCTPFFNYNLNVYATEKKDSAFNVKLREQDKTKDITNGMLDTKNYDYLALNKEMKQEQSLYELEDTETFDVLLNAPVTDIVLNEGETDFPTSVDWSTSEYFPEVGNQGASGSCWHYGTIYASMCFSNNKERGIPASESNTINPIFGYNYAQRTKTIQMDLAQQIGYPSIDVLPVNTKELESLFTTKEVWESALMNRAGEMISVDNYGEEDDVVTGPKDTSLNLLKKVLNDGKVIAVGSLSYNWNTSVVASGEHKGEVAIDRCDLNKTGGHILAIVGYNDDIWIDINYDGKVQEAEMGALKIVNSWGKDWANNGFAWVAYDALNVKSQILTADEATRINNEIAAGKIKANKVNNSVRKSFFMFGVWSYPTSVREKLTSDCRLYMTVNTGSRKEMDMSITATNKADGNKSTYTLPKLSVETVHRAWDGTEKSTDGTMVLDLDNVIPDISKDTMENYTWEVTFKDDKADVYSLTVKDLYFTVNGSKKYVTNLSKIPLNGTERTYTMSLRTAEGVKDPVIEQENKSNVVIYYANDKYKDANMHYQIGSGKWTTAPGVQMCVDSEQSGYTWKYVVNLGKESSLTVCFNENNASWDSNNSSNYTLKAGCYGIKNGKITELKEPVITQEPLIELDKKKEALYVNDKVTLTATVIDGLASDIEWKSSDETVAVVSANGEVTAVAKGNAVITANIGKVSAECEITVEEKAVTEIPELTKTPELTTTPELTKKPELTITPELTKKPELTTTPELTRTPELTKVPTITDTPNKTIELNKTVLEIYKGSVETLVATVKGENQEETENLITWSSEDENIVMVSNTGKVIGVSAGTATITASLEGKTAVCQVTVKEKTVTEKPEITETPKISSVELNKTTINLYKGNVETLVATVKDENGEETEADIRWSSGDESVAMVSGTGKVAGISKGSTTITASVGNFSASCKITVQELTVTEKPEITITGIPKVTSIELNKNSITISEGNVENLVAVCKMENGETAEETIRWTSGDENIAVVSAGGKVVGISAGTTVIKADCNGVIAECQVTVQKKSVTGYPEITDTPKATGIELDRNVVTLTEGNVESLTATVKGETTGNVQWLSSDENVAIVSNTGKIMGVSAGVVIITAKVDGVSTECVVTVQKKSVTDHPNITGIPQADGIELDKTSITVTEGSIENLVATIKGETEDTITWTSSNESVAMVSNTGKVIALESGKAVIIASIDKVSAVCEILVQKKTDTENPKVTDIPEVPEVTALRINKNSLDLNEGSVDSLTVTLEGETKETVQWSSSDENVAVVSNTGKIVAVGKGTADITAKIGKVSAVCKVTVKAPSLTINKQKHTLYTAGSKKVTLKVKQNGKELSGDSVTWYSSNSKVATVSSKGVVTAKQKGKVTITAMGADGLKVNCTITVKKPSIKLNTKKTVTLKKGKTLKINAKSTPGGKFKYKTSSKKIASVSSKGVIKAKKKGTAHITIERNGVKKKIKVVVK